MKFNRAAEYNVKRKGEEVNWQILGESRNSRQIEVWVCSPSTSYGATLLGPLGCSIDVVRRGLASDGISALHSTKRSIIGWNCDSKRNALETAGSWWNLKKCDLKARLLEESYVCVYFKGSNEPKSWWAVKCWCEVVVSKGCFLPPLPSISFLICRSFSSEVSSRVQSQILKKK